MPTIQLAAYQRQQILNKVASLITAERQMLAELICQEVLKPISLAQREVERAAWIFEEAAAEAIRFGGDWLPSDIQASTQHHQVFSKQVPLGPLLALTPFNYPLNLAVHKIAPAMAVGLPFVLKPSPRSPRTAEALINIIHRAGWPEDGAQLLLCGNEEVSTWVQDPRFAILSFTGSTSIGWQLKKLTNAKQVLLELGGNASVVLAPDARWSQALARIAWGAFMYAGQVCIAIQQLWIHDDFYDACVPALLAEVSKIKVGDPKENDTLVPPMIDEAAAQRVEQWVQAAKAKGARVLCGGQRQGALMSPTVLADVPLDMPICCEEVFGPVLVLHRYRDLSTVYQKLSEFRYGLQTSIYTQTLSTAFEAYEKLSMGSVLVNEIPTFRLDTMPYGGSKDSGVGREGVRYTMAAYCEYKNLIIQPQFPST